VAINLCNSFCKILMGSPLFHGISTTELDNMIHCLQPKVCNYKKNSYITISGEPFTGLGILLTGEAAIIKENAAGSRNVMTILQAGNIFGEMITFSHKHVWPASVFAQTVCSVIFLPPDKIAGSCANACHGHTQLIRNMLSILSEKALQLNRKVEYLTIGSMRGKISTYLLEQCISVMLGLMSVPYWLVELNVCRRSSSLIKFPPFSKGSPANHPLGVVGIGIGAAAPPICISRLVITLPENLSTTDTSNSRQLRWWWW
jgi:CRP-like cAMP-binding protein